MVLGSIDFCVSEPLLKCLEGFQQLARSEGGEHIFCFCQFGAPFRAFWIKSDHLGPLVTVWNHFGPFWTIFYYIGLFLTVLTILAHLVENDQNGQKWFKMAQKGPKWPKMVQIGPMWSKIVPIGHFWSKIV